MGGNVSGDAVNNGPALFNNLPAAIGLRIGGTGADSGLSISAHGADVGFEIGSAALTTIDTLIPPKGGLLKDVGLNGVVDFFDIQPLIDILANQGPANPSIRV